MDERTVAKIVLWISTTIAVLSGIFTFVLLLLIGFRGLFLLLFSEDRGTVLLSCGIYQFL